MFTKITGQLTDAVLEQRETFDDVLRECYRRREANEWCTIAILSQRQFTRIVVYASTGVILDELLQQFRDVRRQFIDVFRLLLFDDFQVAKSHGQCVNRSEACRRHVGHRRSDRCSNAETNRSTSSFFPNTSCLPPPNHSSLVDISTYLHVQFFVSRRSPSRPSTNASVRVVSTFSLVGDRSDNGHAWLSITMFESCNTYFSLTLSLARSFVSLVECTYIYHPSLSSSLPSFYLPLLDTIGQTF